MSDTAVLEKLQKENQEKKNNDLIIVFTGPPASGKTKIVEGIFADPMIASCCVKIIPATTRNLQPGERTGVDYWFLTPEEFRSGIEEGIIIGCMEYGREKYGEKYGILIPEVDRVFNLLRTPILVVDTNGAEALKHHYGKENVASIFVCRDLKDILKELEKRYKDKEKVNEKFEQVKKDLSNVVKCDRILYNTGNYEEVTKEAISLIHDIYYEYYKISRDKQKAIE